jgi:glucose-6-phosphate isomerase, archaeal
MPDLPFSLTIPIPLFIPTQFDAHIARKLSSMRSQYQDEAAYQRQLAQEDLLLYEVYELQRPPESGELMMGVAIVHPGKIGQEFHMTKGHYHAVLETSEVYYCLHGEGMMVMENPEGDTAVELLSPGKVLYVPPRWAHRSICTARQQDLVTFFVYPASAGHDYGTIEKRGFRKLVVDGQNGVEIIDNPRWKPQG